MQRLRPIDELRSFAARHSLSEPVLAEDHDGQHLFVYSNDKRRRYAYSLTWAPKGHHLLWVMLNPGTGESEGRRRNTFERCRHWSQTLGFGGLLFGNVFSIRSKSARELLSLKSAPDPLNDEALLMLSGLAQQTIVAWGNHGAKSERPLQLAATLKEAKCFGYTQSGQPRHPLYVRGDTDLVPWPLSDA